MKLFSSFAGRFQPAWLSNDAIAGLTVWAVLVPEALAYATIAGVSPVVGLYAAPPALILYAVFGSSRHLVVGPMAATAALSAAVVGDFAAGGTDAFTAMTVALALVVGILVIVAGLLRLGFLATFISEPVLKGFIVGLALTIIVGQLHKLTGTPKTEGNFFEQLWAWLGTLGQTNLTTLVIGLISLAIVVILKERLPVVPGSLIAVFFGIGAVAVFGLDQRGVEIVGPIQAGLPPFGLPDVRGIDYLTLTGASLGVALVAFAEGLGAAKTYAAKNHYDIDPNQELIALGASNVGAGLFGGMVVNGSLSKTAVNGGAGAKSQASGLIVAVATVITLLFLTSLFEQLPETTLAAVVVAALIELVDWRSLRSFYRLWDSRLGAIYGPAARADFLAAMAALLGVLIFDTLPGLIIGILVSIALLVYRASRPHVALLGHIPGSADQYGDIERNAANEQIPGVVILRPESGLFFANADLIRDAVRTAAAKSGVQAVVLDLETVPSIDLTAAKMLADLDGELRDIGRTLVVAHEVGQVRAILQLEGAEGIEVYPTVDAAVEALQATKHADDATSPAGTAEEPG